VIGRRRLGPGLTLFFLATTGCSSEGGAARVVELERAPEALGAVVDVSASRASPLRFGSPDAAEKGALMGTDSWSVRATFVLLAQAPASAEPLDASVSAIVDAASGELRLTSRLARGATILLGVPAAELLAGPHAALAGDVHTAFPCEVSVRLALRSERTSPQGERAVRAGGEPAARIVDEIGLVLRRGPGELAVDLEAALELSHDGDREIVALAPRRIASPGRVVWILPSPWKTASLPWIAAAVEIDRSPPPAPAAARLLASLAAERAVTPAAAPGLASTASGAIDLDALRARLSAAPEEAIAMLGSRAGVALEAVLALPDPSVVAVMAGVERALARRAARLEAGALLGGPGAAHLAHVRGLGLEIDLAALEVLLSPGLRAGSRQVVERCFGPAFDADLGGSPGPLLPRARLVMDRRELDRLVLLQDLAALDSGRPSLRTRAARHLRAAVPDLDGYDPFGPLEGRGAAVGRLRARLAPGEPRS
jgi:hypothetical protein